MDTLDSIIKNMHTHIISNDIHNLRLCLSQCVNLDFTKYTRFNHLTYTRNLVYMDNDFELILLCWQKNQETPIHDHDNQECLFVVLDGIADEIFYNYDTTTGIMHVHSYTQHQKCNISQIDDARLFHKIKVASNTLLTLHCYFKPIKSCLIYDDSTGKVTSKILKFNTIDGVDTPV